MRYKLLNTNIFGAKVGDIVDLTEEQVQIARAHNASLQRVEDGTPSQTSQEARTDVSATNDGNATHHVVETPQTANTEVVEDHEGAQAGE